MAEGLPTVRELAAILREGKRTVRTLERTKPFLERIAALVREEVGEVEADVGTTERPGRGGRVQFMDRAYFHVARGLPTGAGGPQGSLDVAVLLVSGRLWWGLSAWGKTTLVEAVGSALEELSILQPGEKAETGTGVYGAAESFGGGKYLVVGRGMTAEELARKPDTETVCGEVARDCAEWYRRVGPRAEELREEVRRRVSGGEPAPTRRYWRVVPGKEGRSWQEFVTNAYAGVWGGGAWPNEDLRARPAGSIEELKKRTRDQAPEASAQSIAYGARAVWGVYAEMQPGDGIFAYGGKRLLGMGTVTGDYACTWTEDGQAFHHRAVAWEAGSPVRYEAIPASLRKQVARNPQALVELSAPDWSGLQALWSGNKPPPPPPPVDLVAALGAAFAAGGLHYTAEQMAAFYTALQTKGFVILSGISGTGKTKLAQQFARLLPAAEGTRELPAECVWMEAQRYMVERQRIQLPSRLLDQFRVPKVGHPVEVRVLFGWQEAQCTVAAYENRDGQTVTLLFREPVTQWFATTFETGVRFALEIERDRQRALGGVRLMTEVEAEERHGLGPEPNHLFLPVRPDWRDGKPLLGYYNPLRTQYQDTAFRRFLQRAAESYRRGEGLAWFAILDEMNLARVEYYFADLLSVLESGRTEDGWTVEALTFEGSGEPGEEGIPEPLRLPPNLYIVGTVNVDETTHAFSPKVLDRAFTIELTEADFGAYVEASSPGPISGNPEASGAMNGAPTLAGAMNRAPTHGLEPRDLARTPSAPFGSGEGSAAADEARALLRQFGREGRFARIEEEAVKGYAQAHPEAWRRLGRLNEGLREHDLHFGFRPFKEILMFLANAEANGLFEDAEAAFDAAVGMKVLPKFHGSRAKLDRPVRKVLAWCLDPDEPRAGEIEGALMEAQSASPDTPAGDAAAERLEALTYALPQTASRAIRLLRTAYNDGFAAFG